MLLVQMARRRKEHPAPDVDEAWQRFAAIHGEDKVQGDGMVSDAPSNAEGISVGRFRRIHLWMAAVGGAAACLLLLIVTQWLPLDNLFHRPYVALLRDDAPQRLRIGDRDTLITSSQGRFLSFYDASASSASSLGDASAGTMVASSSSPAIDSAAGSSDAAVGVATAGESPLSVHRGETSATHQGHMSVRTRKLSTPRGMDFKVILPDSSEVWLNAESTIEFPVAFQQGERRVLLHGEAYFKVARNEQVPFVVHTDRMKVSVLGTEFNLRAYDTEASSVALVKGSVQVSSDQGQVLLAPGQEAQCTSEGTVQVHDIDPYGVTQWVEGLFYFDETPLVEVLKELGRWYNFGVVFHRRDLMEMRMHFSASRTDDIDTAIRNLNRLRKVRITIEEENIVVY